MRSNENDDFTKFLYMIGEQSRYIACIHRVNVRYGKGQKFIYERNTKSTCVVCNEFIRSKIHSRVVDELSISKQFEKNRDIVDAFSTTYHIYLKVQVLKNRYNLYLGVMVYQSNCLQFVNLVV